MDRLVWTHKVRLIQGVSITSNVIRWLNSTVGEEFRDWNLQCVKIKNVLLLYLEQDIRQKHLEGGGPSCV
jgi:hypothetical protein